MKIITSSSSSSSPSSSSSSCCSFSPPPPSSLPNDMISEVLSRASMDALRRFRLASKEWNSLTRQSSFTRVHCQRTGLVSGYFIQAFKKNKHYPIFVCYGDHSPLAQPLSLEFLPEEVAIEASSNEGLLYCANARCRGRDSRFYVCKPTTREWDKLPNPNTRFETFRNAMVDLQSQPLHYKIVRLSKPWSQSVSFFTLMCEIFDSANWGWRKSNNIRLPNFVFLNYEPAIYANGASHWLTDSEEIFAFNINRESWKLTPLPEALGGNGDHPCRRLVQCEGKLALFDPRDGGMDLWVLENYSRQTWRKRGTVTNEDAVDLYTNDIVLVQGYKEVTWFNNENQSSTTTMVDKHLFPRDIFPFQSDLKPVFTNVQE